MAHLSILCFQLSYRIVCLRNVARGLRMHNVLTKRAINLRYIQRVGKVRKFFLSHLFMDSKCIWNTLKSIMSLWKLVIKSINKIRRNAFSIQTRGNTQRFFPCEWMWCGCQGICTFLSRRVRLWLCGGY